MNGSDFIDFAGQLSVAEPSLPAPTRSAVSRAYYGAFHLAKDFLIEIDNSFRARTGENEHQFIQRHYQHCGVEPVATLGQLLSNLHESRKVADYRLDKDSAESKENARFCVKRADNIRTEISNIRNDTALQDKVVHGIQAYRKRLNIT